MVKKGLTCITAGYMGVSTGVSGFYFHTVVGSVLASLGAYCVMNL